MTTTVPLAPTGEPYPGSIPAARISSTVAGRIPPTALTGVAELGLVDLEIATDDGRHEPPVAGHEEGGLGGPLRADPEERREGRDRRGAGRGDLLRGSGASAGSVPPVWASTATWRFAA